MKFHQLSYPLLVVVIGFAAVLFWIGLIDVSSTLAQGQPGVSAVALQQQSPGDDILIILLTDPVKLPITDLSGNEIGEGVYDLKLRCSFGNCSQKAELILLDTQYEYKFETSQFLDPLNGTAIVTGRGTFSNSDKKERFRFTAVFQDNQDGTLSVSYAASNPAASFIIPRFPGQMQFQR